MVSAQRGVEIHDSRPNPLRTFTFIFQSHKFIQKLSHVPSHDVNNINTFSREKKALLMVLHELGVNNGVILSDYEKRVEHIGKYT